VWNRGQAECLGALAGWWLIRPARICWGGQHSHHYQLEHGKGPRFACSGMSIIFSRVKWLARIVKATSCPVFEVCGEHDSDFFGLHNERGDRCSYTRSVHRQSPGFVILEWPPLQSHCPKSHPTTQG
jgi:hypothetical protein